MFIETFTTTDGDWIDIFLNGRKLFGGHSISPRALLELLAANAEPDAIVLAPNIEWTYSEETDNPKHNGQYLGVST